MPGHDPHNHGADERSGTQDNVAAAARSAGVNRGYLYRMLGRRGLR